MMAFLTAVAIWATVIIAAEAARSVRVLLRRYRGDQ